MHEMIWNVYVEDFNKKQIDAYNIFNHYSFNEDVKKAYKRHKDDFHAFSQAVKNSLMYYFWSKCEWEVILSDWPPSDNFSAAKVSVYDQVMMNWDVFIQYVWKMAHMRKNAKTK